MLVITSLNRHYTSLLSPGWDLDDGIRRCNRVAMMVDGRLVNKPISAISNSNP